MLKKLMLIAAVTLNAACTSPNFAQGGLELERNIPPISITNLPACHKKKLMYAEDGSLWIR